MNSEETTTRTEGDGEMEWSQDSLQLDMTEVIIQDIAAPMTTGVPPMRTGIMDSTQREMEAEADLTRGKEEATHTAEMKETTTTTGMIDIDPPATVTGIDPSMTTTEVDLSMTTTEIDPSTTTTEVDLSTTTTEVDLSMTTTEIDPSMTTTELDLSMATTEMDPTMTTIDPDLIATTEVDPKATATQMDLRIERDHYLQEETMTEVARTEEEPTHSTITSTKIEIVEEALKGNHQPTPMAAMSGIGSSPLSGKMTEGSAPNPPTAELVTAIGPGIGLQMVTEAELPREMKNRDQGKVIKINLTKPPPTTKHPLNL
jgi:hypothetical protein